MQNRNAAAEAVCPLRHLADVFGGKWKLPIMCILAGDAPVRYSAIRRRLDGVTNVMLTQSLRELESYGLVERRQFSEVPPRVEYSLTERGRSAMPFLTAAAQWASDDLKRTNREKLCTQCAAQK
ncbi:MAG: helix-turn-helix transcriptional regulator [Pyramidobacter sp.]|nr:helix-turn-helix transcriptional regulator [Pyramidobacter sp.]